MGAPINYTHLIPEDIRVGRKYHVTLDELFSLSGTVESNLSAISGLTGHWESTYNTVMANSAEWALSGGGITDLSSISGLTGNWQSTYTTVYSNSGSWENVSGSIMDGIWTNADNAQILYTPSTSAYTAVSNTLSGHFAGINHALMYISGWIASH